jgi:hypothetical protein
MMSEPNVFFFFFSRPHKELLLQWLLLKENIALMKFWFLAQRGGRKRCKLNISFSWVIVSSFSFFSWGRLLWRFFSVRTADTSLSFARINLCFVLSLSISLSLCLSLSLY